MKRRPPIKYSDAELTWVRENATLSRRVLHSEFSRRFKRSDVSLGNLRKLCERNRWQTGRDGRESPIGSERVNKDGYVFRKIDGLESLPAHKKWKPVHVILWEAIHGEIPDGCALKCVDGDKKNTDPLNWVLISRSMLPRLCGCNGSIPFSSAPMELKKTILAVAELEQVSRVSKKGMRG